MLHLLFEPEPYPDISRPPDLQRPSGGPPAELRYCFACLILQLLYKHPMLEQDEARATKPRARPRPLPPKKRRTEILIQNVLGVGGVRWVSMLFDPRV